MGTAVLKDISETPASHTAAHQPLILVLDPADAYLDFMRILLESAGYRVATACAVREAAPQMARDRPALVIAELRLGPSPPLALVELLSAIQSLPAIPLLVCTADVSFASQLAPELERRGIATLFKPFDIDDLLRQVACMLSLP
jgi:DNA-binding NtrC family response regulator